MISIDTHMLADYVDDESNDLLLEIQERVEKDNFFREQNDQSISHETVSIAILSQTMIKMLAILSDKKDVPLGECYLDLIQLHSSMIKGYETKLEGQQI